MRAAIIRDGVVWNVVVVDTLDHPEWTLVACADDVQRGWTWDGTTFTAPVVVTPVPQSVTMRQARRALLAAGKLDAVNAAVAAQPQDAQIQWEYAGDVERDNPLIAALLPALGMTDAQIDDLFRAAATL